MNLYLSTSILDTFAYKADLQLLSSDRVSSITNIKGKLYACLGYVSSGAKGIHSMFLQECIPYKYYSGKTYTNSERQHLVNIGKAERGNYAGQKFLCSGERYVFIGEKITAYPVEQAEQLELF